MVPKGDKMVEATLVSVGADDGGPKSNGTEVEVGGKGKNVRDKWDNYLEFILSTIGYSVGFGNVWRFPYVAYQNGGGAYLIPYLITLIFVGKPLYFLELALGQFTQLGPSGAFRLCPIAAGVGAAMVGISGIISVYYNILMAYTLYFTFAAFQKKLPWTHCDNAHNTKQCIQTTRLKLKGAPSLLGDDLTANISSQMMGSYSNFTQILNQTTPYNTTDFNYNNITNPLFSTNTTTTVGNVTKLPLRTASQEYWDYGVLRRSGGIEEIGNINWDLALILLLSWIITYGCLCRGVKSAGKVIYLTVTLPYILLFILMIRGVTLEGAKTGLIYLFTPQWDKLFDVTVWRAACSQMFFSLSVTLGGVITFSSFNNFRNNCYRDSLIISVMDTVTSLLSGIVIFSVLGYMSYTSNIPLDEVAKSSGPGLVFIVYPEALSSLPVPQLWTVIFFLTLYSLGLDSIVAAIEVVLCALHDTFPKVFPWKYKSYVCLGVCCIFYLLGLVFVTEGGFYVLDVVNFYVAESSLILVGLSEVIAITWIYGYKNFIKDIEMMIGKKLPSRWYWIFTWVILTPLLLSAIYIYALYDVAANNSVPKNGDIPYPDWVQGMGWTLTIFTAGMIPLIAIYRFFSAPGSTCLQKWKAASKPSQAFGDQGGLQSPSMDSITRAKLKNMKDDYPLETVVE